MDWKEKAYNLKKGLEDGRISGTFLVRNASSLDWYGAMVILSKMLGDLPKLKRVI